MQTGNTGHTTHILWKITYGLSNRALPHTLNTSIAFNNKRLQNCFTNQLTNTVRHTRQIDPLTEQQSK